MTYGITTSRAHVNPADPPLPGTGEIDWFEILWWLRVADPSMEPAEFAGRYFLGTATEAEVTAGSSFCLWAHGEAGNPDVPAPRRIVPLQRADDARQSATGDQGRAFGAQDATALAEYLDLCLAVGDLEIIGTKQILVFLEVDDGTALSVDYWASWATTLHDAILYPARFGNRTGTAGMQPLLPAILCAFTFDDGAQTFLPEPPVRACLDMLAPRGFRSHCHGFWARSRRDDPGGQPLSWTNLGEYRQPREILGIAVPYMQRVPVRYLRWFADLRWFDGPQGLPVPEGPLRDTLALVTLDWPATGGDTDPLGAVFTATGWRADASAVPGGPLIEMPLQFGVDKNRVLTPYVDCFAATEVVVSMLPSAYSWEEKNEAGQVVAVHPADYRGTSLATPLRGPCTLAFRYYSPASPKNLTYDEALALSLAGYRIVVVWEGNAPTRQGNDVYIEALLRPFVAFEGREDGRRAFEYAADTILQPSYTPVYFAVDFPPGHPNYLGRPMPSIDDVVIRYFQDVHRGYREFLQNHPTARYYVGAYAQADVCVALYRAGLASHFWQPWPPTWGDNWRPFAYANAWQVVLANTIRHPEYPDMLVENQALRDCTEVDINVAWGDPGGFHVL
jgi:hypothetical protein